MYIATKFFSQTHPPRFRQGILDACLVGFGCQSETADTAVQIVRGIRRCHVSGIEFVWNARSFGENSWKAYLSLTEIKITHSLCKASFNENFIFSNVRNVSRNSAR